MISDYSESSSTAVEPHWENVGSLERWSSVAAGLFLLSYGLSRRSKTTATLAVAAAPLLYRGVTGHCPVYSSLGVSTVDPASTDTKQALGGERGVRVRESVRIERSVDELYRFWRQLENLPRFMTNLERVTDLGHGRSHWVAKGPAGTTVEWEAEVINEIENRLLSWRSLPGADVVTAGSVHFDAARGGRSTEITVNLQYSPPAGKLGSSVAWLFGREPSQTIREDLRRLKQLLETGEIARATVESKTRSA
jgi:uncharacterized membrane protein